MKKIKTIELLKDMVSLGHAPMITEKGKKTQMIVEDGKPITFKTPKEAKQYGEEYINSIN